MGTRRSVPIAGERPPPRFVLWREVLVAYAAPALTAGAGGLVSGRHDLAVAALTSIAGTSALVAALTGARLRRTGIRPRRSASLPKPVLAAGAGLMAAAVAAGVAHLAVEGLAAWPLPTPFPFPSGSPWPERLRLDLPLSAALAAAITTWRWRGATHGAR
ncbi:hypothetical protein ACFWSF_37435 [Streptomyces sp. NPDC058611]|uniref:hypothetical protein n=1 Tax=unclassified Streptomyces TaxID=2593676 RepID=UPI00365C118D